jgi:hypothetical protein
VWIAGHYTFSSGQWIWIPGSWTAAPANGATWVEGRYDARTGQWIEGHWAMNNGRGASGSAGTEAR